MDMSEKCDVIQILYIECLFSIIYNPDYIQCLWFYVSLLFNYTASLKKEIKTRKNL